MNWLDHLILWGYLASTLAHGWYFYKRAGTADHFMAGSGKIPAWAAGLSVLGTFLSSVTFLTYPGKSCAENWNAMVFALTMPLGALFATYVFIPLYRRLGVISIFGYLENRFNLAVRGYGNLCMFVAQIGRAGFSLYLVCAAMVTVMGLSSTGAINPAEQNRWILGAIIVVGVIVTAYTLLGGIEAVIWTDVIQVIILVAGALLCLALLLYQTPGGPVAVASSAWERGKLSFADWHKTGGTDHTGASGSMFDWSLASSTFLVTFLFGLFENLKNYNFEMVYVQRYATVSSVSAARKSVWLSVVMYIALSAVFLCIGTALFAYYNSSPELIGEYHSIKTMEQIFPHFIGKLPAGVRGLLLVAILAAGISTVDSSFNVVATIFYSDIFKRYFRRANPVPAAGTAAADAPTDLAHTDARVLRYSTLVMGILSSLFAILCIYNDGILKTIWGFAGLTGSGLVGLFLIGLFVPRAGRREAYLSIGVGTILVTAFFCYSSGFQWVNELCAWFGVNDLPACPLDKTLTLPLGVIVHFLLGWVCSWFPHGSQSADEETAQKRYNLSIYGFRAAVAQGTEMAPEPSAAADLPRA